MRSAKTVLLESFLVALAGLLLALAANALSPHGLRLGRDYFPNRTLGASVLASQHPGDLGTGSPASTSTAVAAVLPATNASAAPGTGTGSPGVPEAVLRRLQQNGLQLVTSNDVTRLFRDPRYDQGLIVFVDARDDAHYTAGHIPGAHQLNYYRAEQYLPAVLPACLNAMQVVVYCTGGQCEDSELTAIMLRDAGIQRDNLFVYPAGMNEWTALRLPVELGARRSGQIKP